MVVSSEHLAHDVEFGGKAILFLNTHHAFQSLLTAARPHRSHNFLYAELAAPHLASGAPAQTAICSEEYAVSSNVPRAVKYVFNAR